MICQNCRRGRDEKEEKEEILKKHAVQKVSEAYVDAIYYHEMFSSLACWKTIAAVGGKLKEIKSKSAKLSALKKNIGVRVIGLGLKDLATAWSKDGKDFTPNQLANQLKQAKGLAKSQISHQLNCQRKKFYQHWELKVQDYQALSKHMRVRTKNLRRML